MASHAKDKSAFTSRQCTVTQAHENDSQIKWIELGIACSPTIFSISGPHDYCLFADLEEMLQGKRFGSNEEVIAETEAYFESKYESFNKKGIEKLDNRWNKSLTLEGNYVDE